MNERRDGPNLPAFRVLDHEMIIVDTEYTTWPGALESGWAEPWQHREIVQMAAIRVDDRYRETEAFDQLVIPTINSRLSPLFISLTGIEQERVDSEGVSFSEALNDFLNFVDGHPVICMNGDEAVMRENCQLNGIDFPFNNSWHRLRPYLELIGVDVQNLSSGDLHNLTPRPLIGHTHNALHDVRSMARWLEHADILVDVLPTGAPTFDPRSFRQD
jgi:inhibitor of KinA sporulation pathway (predicted exonuclease)